MDNCNAVIFPPDTLICEGCDNQENCIVKEIKDDFRPQGEWITRTEDNGVNYRFYCSCCDREVMLITDYCPYCGAKMFNSAK